MNIRSRMSTPSDDVLHRLSTSESHLEDEYAHGLCVNQSKVGKHVTTLSLPEQRQPGADRPSIGRLSFRQNTIPARALPAKQRAMPP